MTTPERSVEEIVEEFRDKFGIAEGDFCCDLYECDGMHYSEDERGVTDWLTQTLQAERQKREEVVEAERERCRVLICPCGCDIFLDEDGYEEAHRGEALTQPNDK